VRGILVAAAVGAMMTGPAAAQSLNDVGRLLQQQIAPGQQQPSQQDRDRAIYEQGRRDQEQSRREDMRHGEEAGRGRDDRREDDRRRAEDRDRLDRDYGRHHVAKNTGCQPYKEQREQEKQQRRE